MATASTVAPASEKRQPRTVPAWLSLNHAATIFVSAFLLFQVQPLISKFILPWFGGSPAVWTTCMLFFQILLFGGYLYAHCSTTYLSIRVQAVVHIVLLLAAATVMPIVPSESWKPSGGEDPTLRILLLLGATVGLPYFVLSTTGPLVQSWFSKAFAGRSPYRLYSLSNIGSLLALVSYPFVFEPAWDVVLQARVWSGVFVLFAILCGVAAVFSFRCEGLLKQLAASGSSTSNKSQSEGQKVQEFVAPTFLRQCLWIALPAAASLVLLAATNHVCQDVAVVPFLWVIPLSLYLLSFIICFDHERWYRPLAFGLGTLVAVLLAAGLEPFDSLLKNWYKYDLSFAKELSIYFAMVFLVCMTCHGELVRLRPDPKHLTKFYLMISGGGAMGGIFVSLIAPHVFNTFFEWKIALGLGFVVSVAVLVRHLRFLLPVSRVALGAVTALVGLFFIREWQAGDSALLAQVRNFYGIVSVREVNDDEGKLHYRVLRNGAIAHGRQFADPENRRIPVAYYSDNSGVGKAIRYQQQLKPAMRVGAIGLGVGTLAAYARPGDEYRFYEINPEMPGVANTYFTYLKDCRGTVDVVLGDARLTLERETAQQYDVLICDAFSGDSIPTHLATKEAFEIYKKHLTKDGILAVHISNKYLDLFPVIRDLAELNGYRWTRIYTQKEEEKLVYGSDWMLLTTDAAFIKVHPIDAPEDKMNDKRVTRWTDHHTNLFEVLE